MHADRRVLMALFGLLLAGALAGTAIAVLPPAVQSRMEALPPAVQQQLQARSRWLQSLPAAERQQLRARIEAWDGLPPAERARLREHWLAWQAMPVDRQALVRAAARSFLPLPADEREALRDEFESLSRDQRRGWLMGPVLGPEWASLEPLLMQVPASEREPLLAVLHAMPPAQVHQLATLAQRTPPQGRDELRSGLIRTSEAGRAAWLRARLAQ